MRQRDIWSDPPAHKQNGKRALVVQFFKSVVVKLVTALPLQIWHAVICHLFALLFHFLETASTWLFMGCSGPTLSITATQQPLILFFLWHIKGVLIYDTVCLSRHFVVPVRLLPFSQRTKNSLSQTIIIIIIIIIMNLINIKHVCFLENNLFWKVNSDKINFRKVNYFLIFDNIIENKLENIFQCFVMSWKMRWKIMY